jgi:hypothetical protein
VFRRETDDGSEFVDDEENFKNEQKFDNKILKRESADDTEEDYIQTEGFDVNDELNLKMIKGEEEEYKVKIELMPDIDHNPEIVVIAPQTILKNDS